MGIILATTFGLSLWLVLWSIGAKSFDAFLLTIVIVLVAAGVHMASAHLPGRDPADQ